MRRLELVFVREMHLVHGTTSGLAESSRDGARMTVECELSEGTPSPGSGGRVSEVDRCNLRYRRSAGDV